MVSPSLEDLAGNQVGTPFEVNVFEQAESAPMEDAVRIPFEIQ